MQPVTSSIRYNCGIPLGGLGAGTIEIRPDGYFHDWQIFNLGRWAPQPPPEQRGAMPPMPPGALAFFLRAQPAGGAPIVRRLGMRPELQDLYSLSFAQSVESIGFDGRFPVAGLSYHDASLPVAVTCEMLSPFIPQDARASGTPGFYATFRLTNPGPTPVNVSLAATLFNPLAWGRTEAGQDGAGQSCCGHAHAVAGSGSERRLRNEVTPRADTTAITLRTSADLPCKATLGTLTLSVAGGVHSWIAGDFQDFIRGNLRWRARYGSYRLSWLHDFRADVRLPCTSAATAPDFLLNLSGEDIDRLPPEQSRDLLRRLQDHALARHLIRRQQRLDAGAVSEPAAMALTLKTVKCVYEAACAQATPDQVWGDCALASTVDLPADASQEVRFVLAWHFPNFYDTTGGIAGHQYENWFADSLAVSDFLHAGYAELAGTTRQVAETLRNTTLPAELADGWSNQLTTLAKSTWWTRNGDFAVWEGLGCCGLNTTDIMYQGSFNILALFPELQKRMLRMNARFQREDGRVPHLFLGDLDHVNDQFHRVDMSPQFVMLAWRDYVWTGDLQFLRDLWPHVHKAMDAMARLDHDGDALPDHDTVRNTYDVWDFRGAPAYISSLALGAYAAAARIADAVGEPEVAETWRQALRRGRAAMDAKLWNGAYYSLWVDGAERDECCMTDQLSGEWFAALIGFGPLLDPGRVRQAAQAILRWNFEPEGGLINAVYPPERAPRPSTYLNAQACGNWTGIEYAFASLLFELDLPDEAVAIVKSVDRRHRRAGAIWNHVECGEHYYRAMSSWATLLSATGFKLDAPQARVTFAPRAAGNPFRAPWFAPSGWGLFESDAAGATVSALGGALSLRTLCVEGVRGVVDTVSAGRQPIRAEVRVLEAGVELEFSQPITVAPGRPLVVATR